MEKVFDGVHTYEIVDRIPKGYLIWNIGDHMPDGYLPLCMLKPESEQPFPGGRAIRTDNLKAISCPEAQTILEATIYGLYTAEDMEQFIELYSKAKGYVMAVRIENVKAALSAMRKLKYEE